MAKAKKETSTALTKWEEQLAKEADAAAEIESGVGGGQFIGTAGGILKYKGAAVPENRMNVVVIDHILANLYYTGKYDPSNPQPPVCYAFGRVEEELAPHEKAPDKQNPQCHDCQWNEYGTSDVGRGKACKNSRRLALISEGDLEDIEAAEVAYLQLPPTSIKDWAGYVRSIRENLKRPPFAVITEVSIVPDPTTQFKVKFKLVDKIDGADKFEALMAKHKAETKTIDFPYQPMQEREESAPRSRAKQPTRRGAPVPAAPAASTFGRKAAKPKF